jgi:SnoaL-like domain
MSDAVDQKLEALTRRLDELEARDDIVQGLFRYARAVDRSDRALLKTCYHPDAIDVHWIFNGNAMQFADYIIPQIGASRSVRHCISNPMTDSTVTGPSWNHSTGRSCGSIFRKRVKAFMSSARAMGAIWISGKSAAANGA